MTTLSHLRRLYHHMLNGGSITPDDLSMVIARLEGVQGVPAEELLQLADKLCEEACEVSNQREPGEPWPLPDGASIAFYRAPVWAFEHLSDALNAYYEARHRK